MLNKKNQTIVKTVSYILLIIIAIYCVFPFIWMVISAFKPKDEIRTAIPSFVIHAPTLENFKKVLFQAGFINYIKNSFIVSVIACGLSMVIAVMAGYALSRYYKQKLVKVSNFAMMLSQMIPGVLLLVPLYMIMQKFHILETYLCLILAYTTFVIPLCTFMMSSFFDTVPMALEEAACVDGAGVWQTYWKIIFPNMKPMHATVAVLTAMSTWNDVMTPLVIMSGTDQNTLPLAQLNFQTQFGTNYNLAFASYLLALLPILIFYIICQKQIINGVVNGAVK